MSDSLYHGKRFRTLNVIDEGVREVLAIEIPAERVIRVLEQLSESRPLPKQIRVDNGPEFTERDENYLPDETSVNDETRLTANLAN